MSSAFVYVCRHSRLHHKRFKQQQKASVQTLRTCTSSQQSSAQWLLPQVPKPLCCMTLQGPGAPQKSARLESKGQPPSARSKLQQDGRAIKSSSSCQKCSRLLQPEDGFPLLVIGLLLLL